VLANQKDSSSKVDGSRDENNSVCGYTRLDRIRNVVIIEKVRVALIEGKMMESRLRWFGHVRRRSVNEPVRRCEKINVLCIIEEGGGDRRRVGIRSLGVIWLI